MRLCKQIYRLLQTNIWLLLSFFLELLPQFCFLFPLLFPFHHCCGVCIYEMCNHRYIRVFPPEDISYSLFPRYEYENEPIHVETIVLVLEVLMYNTHIKMFPFKNTKEATIRKCIECTVSIWARVKYASIDLFAANLFTFFGGCCALFLVHFLNSISITKKSAPKRNTVAMH